MNYPISSEKDAPFAYHQEVELKVDDITNLGIGVGRINNWVVMVPFVLIGETVKARIFKNHSNYSEADLIEILDPSPERTVPYCKLFTQCGGCQYQHIHYHAQLDLKTRNVEYLLDKLIEHPTSVIVSPAIGSPQVYNYRSKITPHFQKKRNEKDIREIGFLRYGRRSQIVDVEECSIAMKSINDKLSNERIRIRKHGLGRKKNKGGTLLLRAALEGVRTDPKEVITELVGKRSYQFKAGDFFQNNPYILPIFVNYIISQAKGNRFLVDAYCGSGLFTISGSDVFESCLGIEVNASAVRWAQNNALINGLENIKFQVGEAQRIFDNIIFSSSETTVIIDPPRKGCDPEFLEQLKRFSPKKIVYVSCDPATQARDLNILLRDQYSIISIQPFDLFPHTRHIENVVTLLHH